MKNSPSWKVASSSIQGVSHIRSNQPCQDALAWKAKENRIMVVMADGAGSAAFSEIGSRIVCETALKFLEQEVREVKGWKNEDWKKALTEAAAQAREAVIREAEKAGHPLKGYASTIIILVASHEGAAALQVGDGAVILLDQQDEMHCLTKPVESEYLNETVFLTGENSLETAQFNMLNIPLKAAAVLTDGLQMLALKMPGGVPHAPFFQPLFRFTAAENDQEVRNEKLSAFLRSSKITQRADDDLTLLLAVLEGLPEGQKPNS